MMNELENYMAALDRGDDTALAEKALNLVAQEANLQVAACADTKGGSLNVQGRLLCVSGRDCFIAADGGNWACDATTMEAIES